MACIYRHLKPNGEVFYIGIGKTEAKEKIRLANIARYRKNE